MRSVIILLWGKGRIELVAAGSEDLLHILLTKTGKGLTKLKLHPLFQESLSCPSWMNYISYSVPNQFRSNLNKSTWPLSICFDKNMASVSSIYLHFSIFFLRFP